MRRPRLCVMLLAALSASPAVAQTPTPDDSVIGGAAPAPQPAPTPNCIDVQVGSARSYECLNAQLGSLARNAQRPSSAADAPLTATSPGYKTGAANASATANRLGPAYGHSAIATRPNVVAPPPFPRGPR